MTLGVSLTDIIDESVSLFIPTGNLVNFNESGEGNSLITRLVYRAFCTVSIPVWSIVYPIRAYQSLQ